VHFLLESTALITASPDLKSAGSEVQNWDNVHAPESTTMERICILV
jgi:hypothetical protein